MVNRLHHFIKMIGGGFVIHQAGEGRRRILFNQFCQPLNFWPDRLIRQQHVRRSSHPQHFSLRDCSAFEFFDPCVQQKLCYVGGLVRFYMRPEKRNITDEAFECADVFFYPFRINNQCRSIDLLNIFYTIPVFFH